MPGLTRVGIAWALVSFLAALVSSVGYYMPYWLRGHMDRSDVYFGIFRRCNYPHLADSGQLIMMKECGRYTTFSDIPSFYWQIATVAIGTGCGLALLISLTSILAICIRDIFTPSIAKLAGVFQVIAGLCIAGGTAIYPWGWDSREVQQACGDTSTAFNMGYCHIGWALYMTAGAAGITIACSFLSCCASRHKSTTYHI